MLQDKTRMIIAAVLLIAVVIAIVVSTRVPRAPSPEPTVDVSGIQTRAVSTFAQSLTGTAAAIPTSTSTDTPEPQGTVVASETSALSPTPSCYRLKFIHDVTIPDNTPMGPADVFTKTWQVQNIGLCAWRPGFKLVLVGGVAMGGSPFTLEATVNPGVKIEVSVKMVAPTNQTGTVQGTWRMTDENGAYFGDALTVVIVVGNGTESAPTPAPTGTP
jgi:hypothetical protein